MRPFLVDLHSEQASEGADYVEVRISPRRLMVSGSALADTLRMCHEAVHAMIRPVVRLILLVNRDSPPAFLDGVAQRVRDPGCHRRS